MLDPATGPRITIAWASPSPSVGALKEGCPPMLPPPWTTSNITGTPATAFPAASWTNATNGRGSGWPTTPSCISPDIAFTWAGAPGRTEATNRAIPTNPVAVAVTRWCPVPARVPTRNTACALPELSVVWRSVLPSPDAPTNAPSPRSIEKRTVRPGTGWPAALRSATTRGLARVAPAMAVWPSPLTTATFCPASSRRTIWIGNGALTFPAVSVAVAVSVFGPGTRGTPSATKVRLLTRALKLPVRPLTTT
ncbi:MAG: hypothetical protein DMF51_05895 [Acidobacteria bacterium]|nr:MAG: hypothetical protein DMF51_05895 [Acidobacteriota bacterium]